MEVSHMTRRQFLASSALAGAAATLGTATSAKEEDPVRQLDGLRFEPRWLTMMGCTEGCLDFLGVHVADPWLWGASGYCFFMNTCEDLCPSGHTSHGFWMHSLGQNVGYKVDGAFSFRNRDDFEEQQQAAWVKTRAAIDAGHPGFLWEWEWLIIRGYDDEGYHLEGKTWSDDRNPMPWRQLGCTDIGWLELALLEPAEAKPDEQVVRDGISFAIECWDDPAKWGGEDYRHGAEAYDLWIAALSDRETTNGLTAAWHGETYAEARSFAPLFLADARARLGDGLADTVGDAEGHFGTVADSLAEAAALLPFVPYEDDDEDAKREAELEMQQRFVVVDRRAACLEHVRTAKAAEEAGVAALRRVLAGM